MFLKVPTAGLPATANAMLGFFRRNHAAVQQQSTVRGIYGAATLALVVFAGLVCTVPHLSDGARLRNEVRAFIRALWNGLADGAKGVVVIALTAVRDASR